MREFGTRGAALVASVLGVMAGESRAVECSDGFAAGYASAVIEREIGRADAVIEARSGVVYVDEAIAEPAQRERVEAALSSAPCVDGVGWTAAARSAGLAPPAARDDGSPVGASRAGFVLLPGSPLFEPLAADPRWPRFSASHLEFQDDPELGSVGSVAFGGSIPLFQAPLPFEGVWELGIQAGVFSIFDLDADSNDLINSDFWVGVPVSARWGPVSLVLRPHHQSSHLGDEFLLRDRAERIDLDFEAVDGLGSLDLWDWGRIYAGGGYLINRSPDDLSRKYVQAGVEIMSPWALFGAVRPLAALDTQRREEPHWDTDYSVRTGLQLENPRLGSRRLQLLAEYYKGRNPNGQFFDRRIEYVGGGVHFHY